MQIYFLRHARSLADDEKKHEGRYDSPLTEVGRETIQRRALGWQAEGVTFGKIIASPLIRAAESARIIGAILNCPVELDSDWMEMDNGGLAGLTRSEAEQKFPQPQFTGPYDRMAAGTGESRWQLQSRAIRALEKVIQYREGQYLVVAHGGILNATVRTIVGAEPPVDDSGIFFTFGDAGYIVTDYNPARHRWVIQKFEPGLV